MATRKDPPAMTVAEGAQRLHLHPVTLYRLIRAGKLPAARIGRSLRLDAADLDDLFAPQEPTP